MLRRINPQAMSDDDARILGQFLLTNKPEFVLKDTFTVEQGFEVTCSLIKDEKNGDGVQIYHVISSEKEDVLGEGAFSKAIASLGRIEVQPDGSITFIPDDTYAIRKKNTKYARENLRSSGGKYRHSSAVEDYEAAKPFPHLSMQSPVKVRKFKSTSLPGSLTSSQSSRSSKDTNSDHLSKSPENMQTSPELLRSSSSPATSGFFVKMSFSVMNRFKGVDFDKACEKLQTVTQTASGDEITYALKPLVELTLTTLKAYRDQIASTGNAHRDIKDGNVKVDLGKTPPIVKFGDVDSRLQYGEPDTMYGSPGYHPPELEALNQNGSVLVSPSRDYFSLGMLLIGAWNPQLHPHTFLSDCATGVDAIVKLWKIVNHSGCFDVRANGYAYDEYKFCDCVKAEISPEHEALVEETFKQLTSADPSARSLDNAIVAFEKIQLDLELKQRSQMTNCML